jgi:hypothetical protein
MGKTVESFRMALEGEINRWNGFARALRKPGREAFDELMDTCRTYASESSCATNPIVFEPMMMSILLFQQKRISQLEKELQAIEPGTANTNVPQEANDDIQTEPAEPKPSFQAVTNGGEQRRLF